MAVQWSVNAEAAAAANALQPLTLVTPGGAESPCGESFGGPDRLCVLPGPCWLGGGITDNGCELRRATCGMCHAKRPSGC